MSNPLDISAVVTTYNRSDMLARAVKALLTQRAEGVRYEVVVIDNNSTDNTRAVVEDLIAQGHPNLRYVFEPKQGISHGRNAGIAAARADIIAFTDDDVFVTENWVATIHRVFAQNPGLSYVGGKILPEWTEPPPRWLDENHWWPLALLDKGDDPFEVSANNPLCLPTANAAFRRDVFARMGLYSAQFSGREDHEMYMRLWDAGINGAYVPEMVVRATVQPERCLKSYHRRWNNMTGKMNSLTQLDERTTPEGALRVVDGPSPSLTLFGVPGYLYREFLTEGLGWIRDSLRGNESAQLQHENRLYYLAGYVNERYKIATTQKSYSRREDLTSFLRDLLTKVVRTSRT